MIAALLLSAVLTADSATPDAPAVSARLEEAKALFREAHFEEAVRELTSAIGRLTRLQDAARHRSTLADAYLYLGLSRLGLNDTRAAKDALKQLAQLDPQRQLDPDIYAPKVLALFAEARRELEHDRTAAGSTGDATGDAKASPASRAPGGRGPHPWLWAGAGGAALAGGALVLSGRGEASAPSIVPSLTLNGGAGGAFSCGGGLLFRLAASNPTGRTVHVSRFNLAFSSSSPACVSHAAPVFGDSLETFDLAPGVADVVLRRMDLQGDLCTPPNGSPDGCRWQANVVLQTDIGNFGRDLQFSTIP